MINLNTSFYNFHFFLSSFNLFPLKRMTLQSTLLHILKTFKQQLLFLLFFLYCNSLKQCPKFFYVICFIIYVFFKLSTVLSLTFCHVSYIPLHVLFKSKHLLTMSMQTYKHCLSHDIVKIFFLP